MLRKVCCGDRLLIREQAIMHFPEPSLVAGAACRLCSFLGVPMEIERIVPPHVFDLPGIDIVLEELWIRVFVVFTAEGALEIGELDHCHFRVRRALELLFADIDRRAGKLISSRTGSGGLLGRQKLMDILQLVENRFLGVVERLDGFPHVITLRLREG